MVNVVRGFDVTVLWGFVILEVTAGRPLVGLEQFNVNTLHVVVFAHENVRNATFARVFNFSNTVNFGQFRFAIGKLLCHI
jgi:hypothetical protein